MYSSNKHIGTVYMCIPSAPVKPTSFTDG